MTSGAPGPAPERPSGARTFRFAEMPGDAPGPGLTRRRIMGAQAMVAEIRLEPGAGAPVHAHAEEQIAVVLEGRLRFTLETADGAAEELILGPGEAIHLPAWTRHGAEALETARVLDIFAPPTERTGLDG